MINILKYFVVSIFIAIGFTNSSCGSGGDDPGGMDSIVNAIDGDVATIPEDEIIEIIQSLPSPVEMSALIESVGVPFSKGYLASPEQADNYDTNFKKALGLGVLSADLGYLNVYEQNNEVVNYLATIKKIADDLNIGQFFDFQTLKRLASNNDNMDSLMFLSQNSFRQMDEHLRKNSRTNLSALVVTGVWLEGLYLITQIVKDGSANKDLRDRIGEQKFIVEKLNAILQVYKAQDKNFERLAEDFESLKVTYDPVTITVETGEVTTKEVDGVIVVIPLDKSTVNMSDDNLKAIISKTESIRNKLISL